MMPIRCFSDESCTHKGPRYYVIGSVAVDAQLAPGVEADIDDILRNYNVAHELHWSNIRAHRGEAIGAVESIRLALRAGCLLHAVVVDKERFQKWRVSEEEAFYTTYSLHLRTLAESAADLLEVRIDDRSDSYPKQDEKLHIITNHMLAQLESPTNILDLEKVDSKSHRLLQLADVWTGAVAMATNESLSNNHDLTGLQPSKTTIIGDVAAMLGWDSLCYDTMPAPERDQINIWHFPKEFRNTPATRRVVLSL